MTDTLTIETRWGALELVDVRRPGSERIGSIKLPETGIAINRVDYTGWVTVVRRRGAGTYLDLTRVYRVGDYGGAGLTDSARQVLREEIRAQAAGLLPPLTPEQLHEKAVGSVVSHVESALKSALNYEAWSHLRQLDDGGGDFDRDRVMDDARPKVMKLLAALTDADVLHY